MNPNNRRSMALLALVALASCGGGMPMYQPREDYRNFRQYHQKYHHRRKTKHRGRKG